MSRRTRRRDVNPSAAESSVAPEAGKPDELKAALESLRAQIGDIDSRLKSMDEKMRPVDLRNIEDKVAAASADVGLMTRSLSDIEGELHLFSNIVKALLGVGAVGVILLVLVILRLTNHI